MAAIKSYSDLQQSRKLAEILPLESADMCWFEGEPFVEAVTGYEEERAESHRQAGMEMYPCWSLAALLNIIQETIPYKMEYFGDKKVQLTCFLGDKPWELIISDFDNEIDACYEMILKLNELNLL